MKISIVGIGPGSKDYILPIAQRAISSADVVVGYTYYFKFVEQWISLEAEQIGKDLSQEEERAKIAIEKAEQGKKVVVIGSGDASIYSMASIIYELVSRCKKEIEVETIPGISAFLAAGSKLGAPLGHDFCCISLSDLMTPWPIIEKRIEAAAYADFVTNIYNPKSKKRYWQLARLKDIFLVHRSPKTLVAIVKQVCRDEENIRIVSLKDFDPNEVDMFSLVMIGNSQTFAHKNKLITPRGYLNRKPESGDEIQKESFQIISKKIDALSFSVADKWAIARIIHSTGIFDYSDFYKSNLNPISRWEKHLLNGGDIVTDVTMVASGITKKFIEKYNNQVYCFLNDKETSELSEKEKITRSQAGIRIAIKKHPNALYVVGNAPTALIELADELQKENKNFSPVGIIGAPVGFVNVVESKIRLEISKRTPWVIINKKRGGSNIAVSIVNACFTLGEANNFFSNEMEVVNNSQNQSEMILR